MTKSKPVTMLAVDGTLCVRTTAKEYVTFNYHYDPFLLRNLWVPVDGAITYTPTDAYFFIAGELHPAKPFRYFPTRSLNSFETRFEIIL